MKALFRNKTILVTGGTGSIGSEVVRQILPFQPKVVRIFSRDEFKQFKLLQELGERHDVRFLLGDVRDGARLTRAMEDVDLVFHCAAYKHVPFCEYNPFEAVKTNVIGTENVINAAFANNVERVINISTDKAANPMNVLGGTKLLAERLISSAMHTVGQRKILLSSVRFGNVFGSRGSVVPLFMEQVAAGGPVTITDPEMTRFFMSIPQAVRLVFKAMTFMKGGELFILKMPVVRLGDVADVIIESQAPKFGYDPKKIKKKIVGTRPGERMYEVLMTDEEARFAYLRESVFVVSPPVELPLEETRRNGKSKPAKTAPARAYSSHELPVLSKAQIKKLLSEQKIF